MIKRILSLALAATILFSSSGCFGSFELTKKVWEFNDEVTDSKFVNTLIFYVMYIVPVYGLAVFGDVVIFNLIEFWSGDNPLGMAPGEVQEQNVCYEGNDYTLRASLNTLEVFDENGMLVDRLTFEPETQTWYKVNGEEKIALVQGDASTNLFSVLEDGKSVGEFDITKDYTNKQIEEELLAAK